MEHGSSREFEQAAILPPYGRARHIGGHEIRRALNAGEADIQPAREELHRARLCETRCAFDEQMPVGEQTDQQSFDERRAADEARFQVSPEFVEAASGVVFIIRGGRTVVDGVHEGSLLRSSKL